MEAPKRDFPVSRLKKNSRFRFTPRYIMFGNLPITGYGCRFPVSPTLEERPKRFAIQGSVKKAHSEAEVPGSPSASETGSSKQPLEPVRMGEGHQCAQGGCKGSASSQDPDSFESGARVSRKQSGESLRPSEHSDKQAPAPGVFADCTHPAPAPKMQPVSVAGTSLPLQDAVSRFQGDSPCGVVGREREQEHISAFLNETVGARRPGGMYICGKPASGKTAVVKEVLAHWRRKAKVIMLNAMALSSGQRNIQVLSLNLRVISPPWGFGFGADLPFSMLTFVGRAYRSIYFGLCSPMRTSKITWTSPLRSSSASQRRAATRRKPRALWLCWSWTRFDVRSRPVNFRALFEPRPCRAYSLELSSLNFPQCCAATD